MISEIANIESRICIAQGRAAGEGKPGEVQLSPSKRAAKTVGHHLGTFTRRGNTLAQVFYAEQGSQRGSLGCTIGCMIHYSPQAGAQTSLPEMLVLMQNGSNMDALTIMGDEPGKACW
eukprot:scaffold160040_cov22-Tisochrysis_lutea.AAC.2